MHDVIHGDVGMHKVDPGTIPQEIREKLEYQEHCSITLARGEATGHAHILTSDAPIGYVANADDAVAYVLLKKAGVLDHTGTVPGEGHGTRTLDPGYYIVSREREYDPALYERRVVD